jgi:hypothetical protein
VGDVSGSLSDVLSVIAVKVEAPIFGGIGGKVELAGTVLPEESGCCGGCCARIGGGDPLEGCHSRCRIYGHGARTSHSNADGRHSQCRVDGHGP